MEISASPWIEPVATGRAPSSSKAVSSDFETFLRMLTVQMQNQDPLNPVDSSDYAVQLATFSGVEQQVKTNDLLAALGEQLGTDSVARFADWIGKEVRAAAPVYFDGSPVKLHATPSETADKALLVVRDATNHEVYRTQVDVSGEEIEWSGVGPDGQTFLTGTYTFHIESYSKGKMISSDMAETYAGVTEVKMDAGEIKVVLNGGIEVPATAVTSVRSLS